jgi:sigma-E factor negative regulatory protein RseA
MQNDVDQKLSMFIDGELDYAESADLLKRINSDEALKKRLLRYQAIGLALQTEQYPELKLDFSSQISQRIKQEPTYLLPQTRTEGTSRKRLFAMAASTIAAAVLVGEIVWQGHGSGDASVAGLASSQPQKPVSVAKANNPPGSQTTVKKQPMTAQFNDYLQAHNASVYTNGEANFKTYAKVASYQ